MDVDIRKLRPSELVRVVNSTPAGEALTERRLSKHRARAGLRIAAAGAGDGRMIDLVKYAAWLLLDLYPESPTLSPEGRGGPIDLDASKAYEEMRERSRERSADLSASGRDIGELPSIQRPEQRAACRTDLKLFCEKYLPKKFYRPWSADHLRVITKMQKAVLEGGVFCMAMPREFGKTSICVAACLWALLYMHHVFVVIIGPDESHAIGRIKDLKTELEVNGELLADFPEICYPIRKLESISQRRLLYKGVLIFMQFLQHRLVLPNLERVNYAGAIVESAGLTGQLRGMSDTQRDGNTIRPSFVLLDDPQTDESAKSPSQCDAREKLILGAVLGLRGSGHVFTCAMPCTVVEKGDLADRFLDHARHPDWQGEKTKLVYQFPNNMDLWREYRELRDETLAAGAGNGPSNEFYVARRAAMDDGAAVAWPERFDPGEVSAIQSAMNLLYRVKEKAFWAEYQNEPRPDTPGERELVTAEQIVKRTNGHKRGIIPMGCDFLTQMIDVQGEALFWMVAAWTKTFTGYVIDYGVEPEQDGFRLRELRQKLSARSPQSGREGAIFEGLMRLTARTTAREWKRVDGAAMRVERCLIDARWGDSTEVVHAFCRRAPVTSVMPSYGKGIGPADRPISEYRKKPGERIGLNWLIGVPQGRSLRCVTFDANFWKSFLQSRLSQSMGDPGALSLFGRYEQNRSLHAGLAEHLTAEHPTETTGRGRTLDSWRMRPGRDNHFLDTLVACAVAASTLGAELYGTEQRGGKKKRVPLSQMGKLKWA
jgi:phage terminase large subunit GpA